MPTNTSKRPEGELSKLALKLDYNIQVARLTDYKSPPVFVCLHVHSSQFVMATCFFYKQGFLSSPSGLDSLLEVCKGPALACGPQPHTAQGPRLSGTSDNVRVRAGFGSVWNYSRQMLYRTFWSFSGLTFFLRRKTYSYLALILCLWNWLRKQIPPTWLTAPFQKQFCTTPWNLIPMFLYRSPNTKIRSCYVVSS